VPPGYAVDPTAGPMLRFQESLPKLPVPTLSSTASKYLETARPHLTDAAFAKTQSIVNAFVSSPQAEELQRRLQARADQPGMKNWLAEWWNDYAYMAYRDPVVVFVNYYFVHVEDRRRPDPAKRASALLKAMLPFRELTES
jgi:carnitine O-acetyltransferase